MPVVVIDTIKQKNNAIFPIIEDTDLLGGYRAKDTEALRDAIPLTYRKTGMLVWTNDSSKLWQLTALNTWVEIIFGGGGGTSDVTLTGAGGIAVGDVACIDSSASLQVKPALASAVSTPTEASVAGVYVGVNKVRTTGLASMHAEALIVTTPGQALYLSTTVGGRVTNVLPSSGYLTFVGTVVQGAVAGGLPQVLLNFARPIEL